MFNSSTNLYYIVFPYISIIGTNSLHQISPEFTGYHSIPRIHHSRHSPFQAFTIPRIHHIHHSTWLTILVCPNHLRTINSPQNLHKHTNLTHLLHTPTYTYYIPAPQSTQSYIYPPIPLITPFIVPGLERSCDHVFFQRRKWINELVRWQNQRCLDLE